MPNNRILHALCLVLACAAAPPGTATAAGLSTLFTTPQEREIINANRYKRDEAPLPQPVTTGQSVEAPVQQLVREEVTREYVISGITLSRDGPHTVWINSKAYLDGEELDDRSRIKVLTDDEVRLRITAPDGKNYYATSGQKLAVTYQVPVRN